MIEAIRAAPDDVELRLVYADWLQSRGDPRGELIVAQHRGDKGVTDAILARHPAHFFGRFASEHFGRAVDPLRDVIWDLGFFRSCRFAAWVHAPARDQLPALEELLVHPSAALLRHFHLEAMSAERHNDLVAAIAAVVRLAPPTLTSLALGHWTFDRGETVLGKLHVLGGLSQLRELAILQMWGPQMELAGLRLPNLRGLTARLGPADPIPLLQLFACPWPALERLTLSALHTETEAIWAPLLSKNRFPALRDLTWLISADLAWYVEAIASSPLLVQLHTLDLARGILSRQATRVFLAQRARFAHLHRLVLPRPVDNHAISELGPNVELR